VCIEWEPIFALTHGIFLIASISTCVELVFRYNFVKCVLYSIYAFYFVFYFIKCCKNEWNNFICDIFNVILYNPKNDVCMKWTMLLHFITYYLFFIMTSKCCEDNKNYYINFLTFMGDSMTHSTMKHFQFKDACNCFTKFSISIISS